MLLCKTLHYDTRLDNLDFDARSQGYKTAKTSEPKYLTVFI